MSTRHEQLRRVADVMHQAVDEGTCRDGADHCPCYRRERADVPGARCCDCGAANPAYMTPEEGETPDD